MTRSIGTLLACLLVSGFCLAQRGNSRVRVQQFSTGGYTAPAINTNRNGVPEWPRDPEFPRDDFTFVRVLYNPYNGYGRGKWETDWPDADLNFSFRLQQLTSIRANPDPIILELNDPRIFDYPFLYIIEPGGWRGQPGTGLNLSEEEVFALRTYCDQGGFVLVDDFWGEDEWAEFYRELKKVFPDREPVDLDLSHPIFNCVYELQERPQVPSIGVAMSGLSYERPDAQEVHYRAIYDDKGRPQFIIGHNTDLGDGWEREAENVQYFKEYSEPKAYPMGINILFYAMSH
ncbi:MAG: DUF4159 domain-containing protein [Planctomycetaceae bacterium]